MRTQTIIDHNNIAIGEILDAVDLSECEMRDRKVKEYHATAFEKQEAEVEKNLDYGRFNRDFS